MRLFQVRRAARRRRRPGELMTRRRSRHALVVEVTAADDGTLSASWAKPMPRPPLPYAQRPLRCALGRHRYVGVWEPEPGWDGEPGHLGAVSVRCARCGVLRP